MIEKNYIPKNTSDMAAVELLTNMPFEAVRNDIPELLEWLQDTHWEVSPGIAAYFIPHINEITEELIFILNTDDTTWKCYMMNILIARSNGCGEWSR